MTTVDLGRLPRGQNGQLIVGQTGKSPLWKNVSGDATISAAGALTLSSGFQETQTAWTAYTPTVGAGSGSFTTAVATGRYKVIGKTTFISVAVFITTNGTASGFITVTLPNQSASGVWMQVIAGREAASTGNMLQGVIGNNSNLMSIQKYDGTYSGADGYINTLTGVYESS